MGIGKQLKIMLCFFVFTGVICLLTPSLCVKALRYEGETEVTAQIIASGSESTDSDITDSSCLDSSVPVASDNDENTFKTGYKFTFVFLLLVLLVVVIFLITVLLCKKYKE